MGPVSAACDSGFQPKFIRSAPPCPPKPPLGHTTEMTCKLEDPLIDGPVAHVHLENFAIVSFLKGEGGEGGGEERGRAQREEQR